MENISITKKAASRIFTLLDDMADEEFIALRVYITGGGCSGFNYGFGFAKEITEDDIVIEKNDITVVIDPMSMMYLDGSTIDYKTDLLNNQFVISNPAATSTCGCGQSFSMD